MAEVFLWLILYCLLVVTMLLPALSQMCTNINNIDAIIFNTKVATVCFSVTHTTGSMTCAAQCLMRTMCSSFNFNQDNGECTLFPFNSSSSEYTTVTDASYVFSDIGSWPQRMVGSCADHSCPVSARCERQPQDAVHCVITGCIPPVVRNGSISSLNHTTCSEVAVGTHLEFICDSGFIEYGSAVCLENGTWSKFRCRRMPSSCLEVLECNNWSVDGEYLIYLREFQDQRVRVYCHGMNRSQPLEFITLEHPNSGYYPNSSNPNCLGEREIMEEAKPRLGTIVFSKIRINLETLNVNISDKTFASGTAEKLGNYGTARDCYTNHYVNKSECGPKGNFSIDLTDTGFILEPSQEWIAKGWMPFAMVTWLSPAAVDLNCGGYCGGCAPSSQLQLSVNKTEMNEVIASSSTITVSCG